MQNRYHHNYLHLSSNLSPEKQFFPSQTIYHTTSPHKQSFNSNFNQHTHFTVIPFLSLYFSHSKQFIFPQFDQQLLNSKTRSLMKFTEENVFDFNNNNNKNNKFVDLKCWVLNNYPINNYFKNIIKGTNVMNMERNEGGLQGQISNKKSINSINSIMGSMMGTNEKVKMWIHRNRVNKIVQVYIGEVSKQGEKHGYGMQIIIEQKQRNKVQHQQQLQKQKQSQQHQHQYQHQYQHQFSLQSYHITCYQGHFSSNLKHGYGKLISIHPINSQFSYIPLYYYGKFINDQTKQNNLGLMVWGCGDFYVGKVGRGLEKDGAGVLYVKKKGGNNEIIGKGLLGDRSPREGGDVRDMPCVRIRKDYEDYQKVVISQWQQNSTISSLQSHINNNNKTNNNKNNNNTPTPTPPNYPTISQTRIISSSQFYFGECISTYSSPLYCHIILKHGYGTLKLINSDKYIGNFYLNQINGFGKYIWKNLNQYTGEFLNGLKHGTGFWKCHKTQDSYQGQYNKNKRNGSGIYKWGNGNYYTGQFKNDMRHGDGKMVWVTGEIYDGQWKDGLQNGVGKVGVKGKDGRDVVIREAEFVNGIEMERVQSVMDNNNVRRKQRRSTQNGLVKQQTNRIKGNKFNNSFYQSRIINNSTNNSANLQRSSQLLLSHNNKIRTNSLGQIKLKKSILPQINQRTKINFTKKRVFNNNLNNSRSKFIDKAQQKQKNSHSKQQQRKQKPYFHQPLDYKKTMKQFPRAHSLQIYTHDIKKEYSRQIRENSRILFQQPQQYEDLPKGVSPKKIQSIKKKKLYYSMDGEDDGNQMGNNVKNINMRNIENNDNNDNDNEIPIDSLLVPIKWRNIKRKNHHIVYNQNRK